MAHVNYQMKPPGTGDDREAFLGWSSTFGLIMIALAAMAVRDLWDWGRWADTVGVVAPLLALLLGYLIAFQLPAAAPRVAIASGLVFGLASAYACQVVFGGWLGALIAGPIVTLDQIGLQRRRVRTGVSRPRVDQGGAEARNR